MRKPGVNYSDASDLASGRPKTEIDGWASEVAEAVGYAPGGDLHALIQRLGGRWQFGRSEGSPDGGTIYVHGQDDFDLVLPHWTSPKRDQFTIAHELGHYALHSKFGELPLIATRAGDGRSEWEANWFAAGFLMPAKLFKPMVLSGSSNVELSRYFGVSTHAAEIRRKFIL